MTEALSPYNAWRRTKQIKPGGYLLDSGSPNRLWFLFRPGFWVKNPIQGDGLDRHSLLREAEEELAAAL